MSQLSQKSFSTCLLSGTRCPRPASCCSCPRPRTSWSPKEPQVPSMGAGFRTQDPPLHVLTAGKVTHFPLQKKDLAAERGWGPPVPTGSWGKVGTKLPASQLSTDSLGWGEVARLVGSKHTAWSSSSSPGRPREGPLGILGLSPAVRALNPDDE